MIKEKIIELIGPYVINEFSWLDIPWIFSAIIVIVIIIMILRGAFLLMSVYSK